MVSAKPDYRTESSFAVSAANGTESQYNQQQQLPNPQRTEEWYTVAASFLLTKKLTRLYLSVCKSKLLGRLGEAAKPPHSHTTVNCVRI